LKLRNGPFKSVFLRGNHEDMLLSYLGLGGSHGNVYLENGGGMTLASYGVPAGTPGPACLPWFPDDHLQFFRSCRLHIS
jgi:serine/threonine protein phosphatase 1